MVAVPRAACEVAVEPVHRLLDYFGIKQRHARVRQPDARVEKGFGSPPVRAKDAISAVMRDRQRFTVLRVEKRPHSLLGRETRLALVHLRQVVRDEPHPLGKDRWVPGDHHLSPRNPSKLRESTHRIRPVVHREDGESDIERLIREGSVSAQPRTIGADPAACCSIMVSDGSSATTSRSVGSYEPAPAPTFKIFEASPSAAWIAASHRGSGVRSAAYPTPIRSYRSPSESAVTADILLGPAEPVRQFCRVVLAGELRRDQYFGCRRWLGCRRWRTAWPGNDCGGGACETGVDATCSRTHRGRGQPAVRTRRGPRRVGDC